MALQPNAAPFVSTEWAFAYGKQSHEIGPMAQCHKACHHKKRAKHERAFAYQFKFKKLYIDATGAPL